MSYTATEDRTALPDAILPVVKEHCRVDFDDDDATLTRIIGWAIDYCQQFTGLQIFEAEVAWTPTLDGAARYPCPVQPVFSFVVMSDAVDVSGDYALTAGARTAPVWLMHSDGTAFHSDADVTLTAGYADADLIPPALYGNIVRIAATLYENRESMAAGSLNYVPSWMNDMLAGLWVPRA